jgi:hypothetical protein
MGAEEHNWKSGISGWERENATGKSELADWSNGVQLSEYPSTQPTVNVSFLMFYQAKASRCIL